MAPDTSTLYIRNLPVDIQAQFKAYCARRNKTMKTIVIEFMRECIENDFVLQTRKSNRGRRKAQG